MNDTLHLFKFYLEKIKGPTRVSPANKSYVYVYMHTSIYKKFNYHYFINCLIQIKLMGGAEGVYPSNKTHVFFIYVYFILESFAVFAEISKKISE